METNQHGSDQNSMPDHVEPSRPNQTPDGTPGKDAPGHQSPVPGQPFPPGQDEPGRSSPPNEPDNIPTPQA